MDLYQSLSGMVEVELTTADIPWALACIADAGIMLYCVQQTDDVTVRLSIQRKDYRALKRLAERRGDTLKLTRRTGLYWWVKTALKRPVLVFGAVLLLLFSLYLPSRVLFIQVEGNQSIPSRKILEAAEHCGISFGVSRREIRSERVKNALLQAMPELQWAGVNTYGCVAVISIRERAIVEVEEAPMGVSSIVALRDGIIISCTATSGNLLCRPGQAVTAGEILISGYTDCGLTIQATRAVGEVYAQTCRDLTVTSPADYAVKTAHGKKMRCWSLIIGKKRINLWKDSGISDTICDRIYEENYVTLPGGFTLPIALAMDEYTAYESAAEVVDEAMLRTHMQSRAKSYICDQMVAGAIETGVVNLVQNPGIYILTGKYICTEMIGKVQWEQIGENNGKNS